MSRKRETIVQVQPKPLTRIQTLRGVASTMLSGYMTSSGNILVSDLSKVINKSVRNAEYKNFARFGGKELVPVDAAETFLAEALRLDELNIEKAKKEELK